VSHDNKCQRGSTNLELAFRSALDGLLDLIIASRLLEPGHEIDDGNVRSRDTERHTSQLAVQARDDLADGLGGTSGAGDDVCRGTTTATPVLGGWSIDRLLGGSGGMHGGHESLNDAKLVVDNLGKRSEAVGRARCVRNNRDLRIILVEVDTADKHGRISRRSRDDDLLSTTLQVGRCLFGRGEDTLGTTSVK
jgi:hypothetical protein